MYRPMSTAPARRPAPQPTSTPRSAAPVPATAPASSVGAPGAATGQPSMVSSSTALSLHFCTFFVKKKN